jgi:hypothetical protein
MASSTAMRRRRQRSRCLGLAWARFDGRRILDVMARDVRRLLRRSLGLVVDLPNLLRRPSGRLVLGLREGGRWSVGSWLILSVW